MNEDEMPYAMAFVDKCRLCSFDSSSTDPEAQSADTDQYDERCQWCDRFYRRNRLFLNNVG